METVENRYAHLLKPIRELTKNWDIDVASELNDYLEELDDVTITFDGGKTKLNFAEAALLIQGTACIYSRKVELLHNLVYQTLEFINDKNKKRNKQTSQDDADGAQNDHDEDDEAVFTVLDLDVSEDSQESDSVTPVSVAPLPPESLIPSESSEKNKLPLISVKGDVVCSQKDFRINVFLPREQNMILLTLGSAAAVWLRSEDERRSAGPLPAGGDAADFVPLEDDHMEQDHQDLQDHQELQELQELQDQEERVDRHQVVSEGRLIRERRQVEPVRARGEEPPPEVNVWKQHDLYAVLGEDRPFRPGKCYKVPEGLDDGGKRKRRRGGALQDFRTWFRGTFDPPEQKLKSGPKFTDLNYVFVSNIKDKVRSRRRINRRQGVRVSEDELRRTFLQPEEAGPQQQGEEPVGGFMGGDDDDGSDNEQEAFPDDIPAEFGGGPDFIPPEAQTDELNYEDLVKLRIEQLVVTCRGYTQETDLSRRVKDWEDKIRPELLLQEQRPVFDIHDYGDRIVGALNGVGQRRSFSSIVSGLDNFEACKFLLASLQLANDYTVEVDSGGGGGGLEAGVDTMSLTLLSTHRATDRFKNISSSP